MSSYLLHPVMLRFDLSRQMESRLLNYHAMNTISGNSCYILCIQVTHLACRMVIILVSFVEKHVLIATWGNTNISLERSDRFRCASCHASIVSL